MSATAKPPWGGADLGDPGGGGKSSPATARRRLDMTLTPGVYHPILETGTTWAGIAAKGGEARQQKGQKETQTLVIHLMRTDSKVKYQLQPEEFETLVYDSIGLPFGKLEWTDDSHFRTLILGIALDVDTNKLALGISHKIRRGLKTKAVKPIASEVKLNIYWTAYGTDENEITEVLSHFGEVTGPYVNQVFPLRRKDGTISRLAGVQKGDLKVDFKPLKALPTYILVKGKKLKVSFENQMGSCPRCYRFPVKVGNLEACLGKLDPTTCTNSDPNGPETKYKLEDEWEKIMENVKTLEKRKDIVEVISSPNFVTGEDTVELTNVPIDMNVEGLKDWMQNLGIRLENEMKVEPLSHPGNWQIRNVDSELAQLIKATCWGKHAGEKKNIRKIYVDLVRNKNCAEEKERIEEENMEELVELLSEDEETEDAEPLVSLGSKESLDELLEDAVEMRKVALVEQYKEIKKPEGEDTVDAKEIKLERQITAAVLKAACAKRSLEPNESQTLQLRNLVRKRTRECLCDSPSPKGKPNKAKKNRTIDGFLTPGNPSKKADTEQKGKTQRRPRSVSSNRKGRTKSVAGKIEDIPQTQ